MEEPEFIKDAPYSTDMQILCKSTKQDGQGFRCMQLFYIATDAESFHDQWYRKVDGTEPCGHFDTVQSHEIETTCAKCLEKEIGAAWIQCPRCEQWFHDQLCFYI